MYTLQVPLIFFFFYLNDTLKVPCFNVNDTHCSCLVVMYPLQVPIYLAAGTAAQQLDASFCTDSSLEIYRYTASTSQPLASRSTA